MPRSLITPPLACISWSTDYSALGWRKAGESRLRFDPAVHFCLTTNYERIKESKNVEKKDRPLYRYLQLKRLQSLHTTHLLIYFRSEAIL